MRICSTSLAKQQLRGRAPGTLAIISIYFKLKAILRPRKALHAETVMLLRLSSAFSAGALAILCLAASPSVAAEITVGLVTTMSGPGASIGIPYAHGAAAGAAYAG